MTGYADYLDFYQRGPYAPWIAERRLAGGAPVRLFTSSQPAGHYPAPPTPDFKVQICIGKEHAAEIDVGAGQMRFRGRRGLAIIAPPDVGGDYRMDGPADVLFTSVPTSVFSAITERLGVGAIGDLGRLHAAPLDDPLVGALCHRLWLEAADGGVLGSLFVNQAVQTLALSLLSQAGYLGQARIAGRPALADWRLRRCLDYLHDNLASDIGLDELASAAGLSPVYFARQFKRATGLAPHQYLIRQRVERAKDLLATTELPLAEVALACGFGGQEHLTRLFRKQTGTTPAAWRRSARD